MIEAKHYADGMRVFPLGEESGQPLPIQIEMKWVERRRQAYVDLPMLRFEGSEGSYIKNRALSGLNGGVGLFEAMPYQVEIGDGNSASVFDMAIDFTKDCIFVGECGIEVEAQVRQGADWLNDRAEGVTFRYLYDQNIVSDSDFVDVPYVINYVPDGVQLMLISLSLFAVTKELLELTQAIAERIADITDAATPVIGVGVGAGAVAVTAWDIGNIILAVLKLAAQIAYAALMVIAIVDLMNQLFEQLMPRLRYHKGIPIRLLFERFCNYFGLTLQSDLLDSLDQSSAKWCYIPPKNNKGGDRPSGAPSGWKETGLPVANSTLDTPAGVIRVFKEMFNADFLIEDGVFRFERKDQFRQSSPWVIPNTFTNQEEWRDYSGFNASEIKSNYNIVYSTDLQDQNTLDNIEGFSFQAQFSPNQTTNQDMVSLGGLEQIRIPFSMGLRKNELTGVEIALRALATLADALTGQLGSSSGLAAGINSRLGSLLLSNHFTSIGKLVVLSGGKLAKNQRTLLSTQGLWDSYHFVNSFVPINGIHNQYWIYQDQTIPFCYDDFKALESTNLVTTPSGELAEVERLVWSKNAGTATIDYRVNRLYTNNLKVEYL